MFECGDTWSASSFFFIGIVFFFSSETSLWKAVYRISIERKNRSYWHKQHPFVHIILRLLSSHNACNNNLLSVVLSLFVPYKFVFVFKVFKCECNTATARFSCCTLVTGQIMIAHSVAICFNLLTSKCGYNLISSKRQQFSLALNMTFRKRPHATASSAAATTTTFTILVSLCLCSFQ